MTANVYANGGGELAITPTAVMTSAYTASPADYVPCNISGGSFTITLPDAPAAYTRVGVKVVAVSGTNELTLACSGTDRFNEAGGSTTATLSLLNQGTIVQYNGGIWYVTDDSLPLSALDARYDAAGSAATVAGDTLPLPTGSATLGTVPMAIGEGNETAWGLPGISTAPSWDTHGTTYTLQLSDDFTGTELNTEIWGAGWQARTGVSGPINTAENALYNSTNVTVSGSCLTLALSDVSSDGGTHAYTGACVTTNPNGTGGSTGFAFTYGAIEARIWLAEAPNGSAIANWPAFWLDGQSWPQDGEIDVVEGLGGVAQQHFHWANSSGTAESYGGPPAVPDPAAFTGWHLFGCNWTESQLDFYIDGELVRSMAGSVTDSPMYIIFDNTCGADGGPTVTGVNMLVDWVRVWSASPAAIPAGISTLTDSFTDPGTLNSIWTAGTEPEPPSVIGGGVCVVWTDSDYDALNTGLLYSLEGDETWLQVTPSTEADSQTWFGLFSTDLLNNVEWEVANGSLYASITQTGTQTTLVTLTYSPSAHAWWKIAENGSGTIEFSTSPDGVTWTQRASTTYSGSFPVGQMIMIIGGGNYGTAVLTDASIVANLNSAPPSMFTKVPGASFSAGSGTSAQTVTGVSAYLPAGSYKLRFWAPVLPAGATGSTQSLAWTFSGTVQSALTSWRITSASAVAFSQGTSLTGSVTGPTMTAAGYLVEWEAYARIVAPGTLQLTVTDTTSGDELTIPAGASIDVRPAMY